MGRKAAARKYEALSARTAFALAQIATGSNWPRGEWSMSQTESARIWVGDEPTVKHEIPRRRAQGWRVQNKPDARVQASLHGFTLNWIIGDTGPVWPLIRKRFHRPG